MFWVEVLYLSLCHVYSDVSCSGWRCCTFLCVMCVVMCHVLGGGVVPFLCAMCVVIVIIQVLLLLLPINKIFIFKRLDERM